MKKLGAILILITIGLSFSILAQEPGSEDKAYQCLEDRIANKSSESLSLQEAVFATLALGSESELKKKIEDEMSNQNCWPKSSCTIKETAQVVLAYDRINKNSDDAVDYLLTKNGSATELTWYLQIDIKDHIQSTCTISYDERDYNINIGEDMKVSGGAGGCLSLSSSGYWLQISKSCYGKTFQISCDEDFITSLLYQKSGSQTIFVTSETNSAPSSGTTEEKVDSQCFKSGNSCDYEGTLWAALALQRDSHEITTYLPYLLALSTDNQKLFPSTYLYMLTSGDDQYNEIVQSQKQSGFWEAPNSKYNKFYDTSLGMLALQGTSSAELDLAKSYLLSVQTSEGCWNNNNIRDTGFILYSGWPRGVSSDGDRGLGGPQSCEPPIGYCGSQFDCLDARGQVLDSYDCSTFGQSCCSVPLIQETCSEKSGIVCPTGQDCSGTEVSSIDGSCCLATCQPASQASDCETFGGFCSFSCQDDEEQTSDSCDDFSSICCMPKLEKKGSGIGLWVWILIILIILVVVAIIFRKKLQMLLFKFKNRKSGKPSGTTRGPPRGPPRFPPAMRRGRPPIRRAPLAARRAPIRRAASKSDKEMDETLKKLREMSK